MKRTSPDGSTQQARKLRNEMTDAERKIWTLLRTAFPDWRFRRQVPIRQYITDFASHRARLVIEIDGGQHSDEVDAPRSSRMTAIAWFVSGTMMCSPILTVSLPF